MTDKTILEAIATIEDRIDAASPESRDAVLSELRSMMSDLRAKGRKVPQRLRELEEMLIDEAVEDQFDNLPV